MGGIAGQYTRFEQVEVQSAICDKVVNGSITGGFQWEIEMTLKNTGTRDVTLTSAFINEREVDAYGATTAASDTYCTNMSTSTYIRSGNQTVVKFWLSATHPIFDLTSGTTINIKIHSSGGMDYPKLVELV